LDYTSIVGPIRRWMLIGVRCVCRSSLVEADDRRFGVLLRLTDHSTDNASVAVTDWRRSTASSSATTTNTVHLCRFCPLLSALWRSGRSSFLHEPLNYQWYDITQGLISAQSTVCCMRPWYWWSTTTRRCRHVLLRLMQSATTVEYLYHPRHNGLKSRIKNMYRQHPADAIRGSWTTGTFFGQQPTNVKVSSVPVDQYSHYSARLSRRRSVAKEAALGEMKFLRRGAEAATPSVDGRVPADRPTTRGRSGLTSLSPAAAAVTADNHQLPVPRDGRPQSVGDVTPQPRDDVVAAAEMWLTPSAETSGGPKDGIVKSYEMDLETVSITGFNLSFSDRDITHSIPRVLHQTSDDATVPMQVCCTLCVRACVCELKTNFHCFELLYSNSYNKHYIILTCGFL